MNIAIVTGSRSDRGALEMVAEALRPVHAVEFVDVSPPFDIVLMEDCAAAAEGAGQCMRDGFTNHPDLIILHGDRYEILGAAMAANIMGLPIAHLGGGDITEGSQDDSYRHAITKLSHLHFPTHQAAGDRIIQMGEPPDRVHVVGDPSVDRAMRTETMGREETFTTVGLSVPQRAVLMSFHPNPLGDTPAEVSALGDALSGLGDDASVVWIGPNADASNDVVREYARNFCSRNPQHAPPRAVYHDNLDPKTYFGLMRHCDVMVGNSSAGLIEAPCFGLPVVNIGDRQKGRPCAVNVIPCAITAEAIFDAVGLVLREAQACGRPLCVNPYGDGRAAERIAEIVGRIGDPRALLRRRFHEVRA